MICSWRLLGTMILGCRSPQDRGRSRRGQDRERTGLPCWIGPSGSSIIGRGRTSTRRMWPEGEQQRECRTGLGGGFFRGVKGQLGRCSMLPNAFDAGCSSALEGLYLWRTTYRGGATGIKCLWRWAMAARWPSSSWVGDRKYQGLRFA